MEPPGAIVTSWSANRCPHWVRVLKPDEISRVVEKLPEQWRAFVLLGAYGSLRWSELVAVKRDDVDIAERTVRIDERCTELNGRFVLGPDEDGRIRSHRGIA